MSNASIKCHEFLFSHYYRSVTVILETGSQHGVQNGGTDAVYWLPLCGIL